MDSKSSREEASEWSKRNCFCGLRAPMWTSWTDDNPSRRFIGCPNYKDSSSNCKFFCWVDPELGEGAKRAVLANRLRSEIAQLKEEKKRLVNEAQISAIELKKKSEKIGKMKLRIEALKCDKFHLQLDVSKAAHKQKLLTILAVVLCAIIVAMFFGVFNSFSNPVVMKLL
ncbi:hypothetical protein CASFOL_033909 [Castilleja foliolosa]|uniref:GRF-type domain-containing protein n=1 Tax=Castilleja foliolosa TaxID=1961234 RepID=A0ABD3BYA6_9LAMI